MRPPTGKFFGTPDRLSELRRLLSYRRLQYWQNMGKLCLRHSEVFEETVVVTVQFTHECVEFSTVIPRLQCLVHPDSSLASILSPLSPSHPHKSNNRSRISRRLLYAAIIDDALRWLRQRDKAVNSFAYRCPFPAGLSPSVNASAGGKVSRRAIYRRNTA